VDLLIDIVRSIGAMLEKAGVYVIVGFLAAGLVFVLVSRDWMTRHLGGKGTMSVLKAALVGVPLPLCSCSVLPTAYALRRKGAGRGATIAFLISTPETGVDSIALTWALMGPVMAIVRPVAACITAVAAGLAESLRGEGGGEPVLDAVACDLCHSDTCEHAEPAGRWSRFWRFVLFEIGEDVGPSLALGLVLAGLVSALVGEEVFTEYLANAWLSMAVMLVVGLPLYVCATASTPLAAALVLKGLNPGAALVLLLVGPATNLATILTVGRMFGKASAAVYVGTIAVVALGCGAALDALAGAWAIDVTAGRAAEVLPGPVRLAGAVVLGLYLAWSVGWWLWRRWPRAGARAGCCRGGEDEGGAEHAS